MCLQNRIDRIAVNSDLVPSNSHPTVKNTVHNRQLLRNVIKHVDSLDNNVGTFIKGYGVVLDLIHSFRHLLKVAVLRCDDKVGQTLVCVDESGNDLAGFTIDGLS